MRTTLLCAFVWFAASGVANAHSAGPEAGRAGDPPNNKTCIDSTCHGGTLNGHSSSLSISGVPVRYTAGASYTLTISIGNPQSGVNGFEFIGRRPVSAYDVAGSLAAGSNKVQVDQQGYAKQNSLGSQLTSWTTTWTAPAAGFGAVRFYAAGNASNNSNTADSGDWIMTATADSIENLAPSAPGRNAPAADAILPTGTPALSVNAASDGNGDALSYSFQTCNDASCASVKETSAAIPGVASTVGWTPTVAGAENQAVYWRCRANDGLANGPWMPVAKFWVDAVAESPSKPAIQQPVTGTTVYSATPLLVASISSDPDPGDLVDYEFTVANDPAFSSVVTFATHVLASGGQVTWQVPGNSTLTDAATYYLLVQAVDLLGNRSPAAYASFTVNLTYTPPTTPDGLSPNGTTEATNTPLLSANAATGTGAITYDFALDAAGSFAPALRSAAGLAAPAWTVPGPALADGRYYWRIRAFDGTAYGNFAYASFFIDAVNDPPGAPSPDSPLDGGLVNSRRPPLRAGPAADPEGDALSYLFEISANAGFSPVLQTSGALAPATDGTVAWTLASLTNGVTYFWRVRARDAADALVVGPYSAVFQFQVVNANLPPGAPGVADRKQAVAAAVAISAVTPDDPDGDAVTLRYELYADSNLAVPVTSVAGVPGASPAWTPDVKWTPGTYYWRAQAADAFSAGSWSETAKLELTGPLPWKEGELPPVVHEHTEKTGGCAAGGANASGAWLPVLALILLRVRRRAWLLAGVAVVLAACGDERTVREEVPAKADWAAVSEIIDGYCYGCHSGKDPSGGTSFEAGAAALVGVKPVNEVARDRGWLLVAPGKPERSFLLYKVTTPPLGTGDTMPQKGPHLDGVQIETLRRWIAEGAAAR